MFNSLHMFQCVMWHADFCIHAGLRIHQRILFASRYWFVKSVFVLFLSNLACINSNSRFVHFNLFALFLAYFITLYCVIGLKCLPQMASKTGRTWLDCKKNKVADDFFSLAVNVRTAWMQSYYEDDKNRLCMYAKLN